MFAAEILVKKVNTLSRVRCANCVDVLRDKSSTFLRLRSSEKLRAPSFLSGFGVVLTQVVFPHFCTCLRLLVKPETTRKDRNFRNSRSRRDGCSSALVVSGSLGAVMPSHSQPLVKSAAKAICANLKEVFNLQILENLARLKELQEIRNMVL